MAKAIYGQIVISGASFLQGKQHRGKKLNILSLITHCDPDPNPNLMFYMSKGRHLKHSISQ